MKKALVFVLAVVLLLNTFIFADEPANYAEKENLAAFAVSLEYGSNPVSIALDELSEASGLSFSYNTDTGFLYADDGVYKLYLKVLDNNLEINEDTLVFKNSDGVDLTKSYRFKLFAYMCRREVKGPQDKAVLDPAYYFEGRDNASAMLEAEVHFDDKAHFVLRKLGTSTHIINKENAGAAIRNNMLLVNRSNMLDRSYVPSELIYSKPSRGRSAIELRLNKEAMGQLNLMLNGAYADGVTGMVITSAYRNFDKQTSLYNNKTTILSRKMNRKTALEEASKVVAIPGTSEHQTGLAADICTDGVGLISSFGGTKQGKWLKDNSWKYGYIIRYPEDKTDITRIIYEPWHVRYVGDGHAELMKAKNMCLEEYVEYLKGNGITYFTDSNGSEYMIQYIDRETLSPSGIALNLNEDSTWTISNCTKDSYVLTIKL